MTEDKLEEIPQKEEKVHFVAPAIQNNIDGWGPCELPDQFKDIPYQPFSKGDRLGKVGLFPYAHMLNLKIVYFISSFNVNVSILFYFISSTDIRLDWCCVPG